MIGELRVRIGWRLLCAAWSLVFLFRIALVLFGFRRLARLFPAGARDAPHTYERRVAAAVQTASRFVPGATCLAQACAARALLSGRGYAVTMRIGVRRGDEGQVVGHAWLLSRDRVILGENADAFQQYQPIADFG